MWSANWSISTIEYLENESCTKLVFKGKEIGTKSGHLLASVLCQFVLLKPHFVLPTFSRYLILEIVQIPTWSFRPKIFYAIVLCSFYWFLLLNSCFVLSPFSKYLAKRRIVLHTLLHHCIVLIYASKKCECKVDIWLLFTIEYLANP